MNSMTDPVCMTREEELLGTQAALWQRLRDPRLSPRDRELISSHLNRIDIQLAGERGRVNSSVQPVFLSRL